MATKKPTSKAKTTKKTTTKAKAAQKKTAASTAAKKTETPKMETPKPQQQPSTPAKAGNGGLIASILFAGLAVAGSLVFFAIQLGGNAVTPAGAADKISDADLDKAIRRGIDAYVEEKMNEQEGMVQAAVENIEGDDAVIGDPDAPITIVEFSDFQCPFCRVFYVETYSQLKEKYIDTGKVKLIYRDFPLNIHEDALMAAEAAECVRAQAGDEGYFQMHDMIFEGQEGFSTVPIEKEDLEKYAAEIGVDAGEFDKCMTDGTFEDEVMADLRDGASIGVQGTPAFFINGQLLEGAQPIEQFENIIEAQMAALDTEE